MDITEKFKQFILKLQNLEDKQKKIILWTIVAVLAAAMGYFWFKITMNRLSNLGSEIGKIQLPQIEMSNIDQNSTENK